MDFIMDFIIVTSIFFSSLLWLIIGARMFLNEKDKKGRITGLFLTFLGILTSTGGTKLWLLIK